MTKQELNTIIAEEKAMYIKSNYPFRWFTHQKRYLIWKYLAWFRRAQFYREQLSAVSGLRKLWYKLAYPLALRRKNVFGEKCGVEITNNSIIGRKLSIWHSGVVIDAQVGDNVSIRGNMVLGSRDLKCTSGRPVIGDGVEIGYGAAVIGNVTIADGCIIGANAVVTKSFLESGTVIVGVPAKALKKGE